MNSDILHLPSDSFSSQKRKTVLAHPYYGEFLAALDFDDGWTQVFYPELLRYIEALSEIPSIELTREEVENKVHITLKSSDVEEKTVASIFEVTKKLQTEFHCSPIFQHIGYNPYPETYALPWLAKNLPAEHLMYERSDLQKHIVKIHLIQNKLAELEVFISQLKSNPVDLSEIEISQMQLIISTKSQLEENLKVLQERLALLTQSHYASLSQKEMWMPAEVMFWYASMSPNKESVTSQSKDADALAYISEQNTRKQNHVFEAILKFLEAQWEAWKKQAENIQKQSKEPTPEKQELTWGALRRQQDKEFIDGYKFNPIEQEIASEIQRELITPYQYDLRGEKEHNLFENEFSIYVLWKSCTVNGRYIPWESSDTCSVEISIQTPFVYLHKNIIDTTKFKKFKISETIKITQDTYWAYQFQTLLKKLFIHAHMFNDIDSNIQHYDRYEKEYDQDKEYLFSAASRICSDYLKKYIPTSRHSWSDDQQRYEVELEVKKNYLSLHEKLFWTLEKLHREERLIINALLFHPDTSLYSELDFSLEKYTEIITALARYINQTQSEESVKTVLHIPKQNEKFKFRYKNQQLLTSGRYVEKHIWITTKNPDGDTTGIRVWRPQDKVKKLLSNTLVLSNEITDSFHIYDPYIKALSRNYLVTEINPKIGLYNLQEKSGTDSPSYLLRLQWEIISEDKGKTFDVCITPKLIPVWEGHQETSKTKIYQAITSILQQDFTKQEPWIPSIIV